MQDAFVLLKWRHLSKQAEQHLKLPWCSSWTSSRTWHDYRLETAAGNMPILARAISPESPRAPRDWRPCSCVMLTSSTLAFSSTYSRAFLSIGRSCTIIWGIFQKRRCWTEDSSSFEGNMKPSCEVVAAALTRNSCYCTTCSMAVLERCQGKSEWRTTLFFVTLMPSKRHHTSREHGHKPLDLFCGFCFTNWVTGAAWIHSQHVCIQSQHACSNGTFVVQYKTSDGCQDVTVDWPEQGLGRRLRSWPPHPGAAYPPKWVLPLRG